MTKHGVSWGGRALVALALSVVLAGLLSRVVDDTVQRFDPSVGRYLVSEGTTGRNIGLVLVAVAGAIAVHAIIDALIQRGGRQTIGPYAGLTLAGIVWWAIATAIHRDMDQALMAEAGIAVLITVAVVLSPPNERTLLSLTHVVNFAAAAGLLFAALNPETQIECRPDKCGIFGQLFTGFLYQENGAARLVLLLLPVAVVVRSRGYFTLTVALAVTYVAATGSRTSILALVLVVAAMLIVRRVIRRRGDVERVPFLLRAAPLGALVLSTWFLMVSEHREFTGRGEIWARLRDTITGYDAILGPGPGTVGELVLAYGARAFGEHGQAPHMLVNSGVIGLAIMALALCAVAFKKRWDTYSVFGLLLLLVAATQFITEPAWELNIRSMSFVCMIASAGLFAASRLKEDEPPAADESAPSASPGRTIAQRANI